jgi:hypothetical protein
MSVNRRDFLRKVAGASAAAFATTLADAKPPVQLPSINPKALSSAKNGVDLG